MGDKRWSLALVLLGILIYFAGISSRNESVELVVREAINPCYFSQPGPRQPPPYPRGVKYCSGTSHREYERLMEHIRQHATGDDEALIAAQFGSAVRLIYLPGEDMFMFNPLMEDSGDSTMIKCQDDVGEVVERSRPNRVRVTFVNKEFHSQIRVFEGPLSCLLQAISEIL